MSAPVPSTHPSKPAASNPDPPTFPHRLLQALCTADEDIVRWNAAGTVFAILDKQAFEQTVLRHHFQSTKYSSFARKLSRWGFRRVRCDDEFTPDTIVFHEPHFQRDHPLMLNQLSTVKQKKRAVALGQAFSTIKPADSLSPSTSLLGRRPKPSTVPGVMPQPLMTDHQRTAVAHRSPFRHDIHPTPLMDPQLLMSLKLRSNEDQTMPGWTSLETASPIQPGGQTMPTHLLDQHQQQQAARGSSLSQPVQSSLSFSYNSLPLSVGRPPDFSSPGRADPLAQLLAPSSLAPSSQQTSTLQLPPQTDVGELWTHQETEDGLPNLNNTVTATDERDLHNLFRNDMTDDDDTTGAKDHSESSFNDRN